MSMCLPWGVSKEQRTQSRQVPQGSWKGISKCHFWEESFGGENEKCKLGKREEPEHF